MSDPANAPSITEYTILCFMLWLVPLYTSLILLFRLVPLYPPPSLSRPKSFLVYGISGAFKVARLVYICITLASVTKVQRNDAVEWEQRIWHKMINANVEWILQPLDNMYSNSNALRFVNAY